MGNECSRGMERVSEDPLVHGCREKKPEEDGWCFARQDKFSLGRGNAICTTDCGLFISLLLECVKVVWQEVANKQVSCVGDLERQSC